MNKQVKCDYAGIGQVCNKCGHAILHSPIEIGIGRGKTCKLSDMCSVIVDNIYKEIKVKCRVSKR